MRLPKPKTVRIDCDTCGLDWSKHKPDAKGVVRLDECVRLLKEALLKKPVVAWGSANTGTSATNFTNPSI